MEGGVVTQPGKGGGGGWGGEEIVTHGVVHDIG